jgi:autotransporter translocation and assembly factor TamB
LALLAVGKVPGQSAAQGSTSSEGAPSEAAELAADVVSNYLTREIRSAGMNVLDLDVVRVSPSEKGNEWTVGRYWGSKLFLSYSYTPEDAANQVLKAEYSLTPRWTFVGQTGSQTDNYLDLTFRLPVGKSKPPKK